MCGLVGGWQQQTTPAFSSAVHRALKTIHHRGPNDSGEYGSRSDQAELLFGSARLSVLDLSTAGHMPMISSDERFAIAYNGEITNYLELKQDLLLDGRTFRSATDTEVLLTAWQEWGPSALTKFEGMFAFAIHDKVTNELIIARDSFGIKPLFFHHSAGRIYFASEIQAIKELIPWKLSINQQVAFEYLHWGHYDSSSSTFLESVEQVSPGHVLRFNLATGALVSNERYWWPDVSTTSDLSFEDAAHYVRDLFVNSVNHNLRTDVPLGIALSGGVDSSAITCAVRQIAPELEINTFSYVTPGFEKSEHEWVRLINAHVGARGHEITPKPDDLTLDFDAMISAQGEPFGSTSIYAQYRVFQAAKEAGITVTLDGQGADEIYAGYDGYPLHKIHSLFDKGKFVEAKTFINNWGKWPNRDSSALWSIALRSYGQVITPQVLKGMLRNLVSPQAVSDLYDVSSVNTSQSSLHVENLRGSSKPGVRQKAHMRQQLMQSGLPALLRHGDRNSMHFSIESRVPFLDKKSVEFVFSLPEKYLVSAEGESKHLLKASLKGLVPSEILERRDKVGFETPELQWQQIYLDTHKSELLASVNKFPFLNLVAVTQYFELKQVDTRFQWRLINLLRWSELAV
jgi:asparagine synthase (glutamine-hydrolysing)